MATGTKTRVESGGAWKGSTRGKEQAVTTLRAAAVLTTSHVASSDAKVEGATHVTLEFLLASVDYTSIQYWVEGSPSGADADWFTLDTAEQTLTLANLESATDGQFSKNYALGAHQYVRVKIKRTGGSATGTAAIRARAYSV